MRNLLGYVALIVCVLQVLLVDPAPTPPVPPTPTPVIIPDPPVPPVPPVEQGKRTVAIIYETEDSTDEFARTVLQLRTGQHADELSSKGHTLYVLDDDTENEDNQLADFVKALLPLNSSLPCIYVLDSSDGRPLANKTVTFDVTAEEVMAFIRENGG